MRYWAFDLDGTLVDSFAHYFALLGDLFRIHGLKFSDDLREPALTEPLPAFFERHLGRSAVKEALDWLQNRSNEDAREIRPFEGLADFLAQLRARGDRVAVWTNRDLVSARLILEHSGLDPHVELCVSGSCVSERKPSSEGLHRITRFFGCEAESVVMVGDHECDVLAAQGAGALAVRASWHGYWTVAPCEKADRQFFTFTEFREWAGG